MTTLKAETLRALAEKATPGPWRHVAGDAVLAGKDASLAVVASFERDQDRDLSIYLRNAVPEILALLEADKDERVAALEADNGRMREALEPFVEGYSHTAVFLRTREKMHSAGLDLYREDVERARRALGRDQA